MGLLREGRDNIAAMLVSTASPSNYGGTGGTIQVGSGTASCHDATRTALVGIPVTATMESGYPLRSANIMQFRGLYATNVANFEWWEHSVGNSTASCGGDNLYRAWEEGGLGTKAATQSWQLTSSVTLTT